MANARKQLLLAAAAHLLAAGVCRAQLMYYDADNSRVTATNSFATAGTQIAGTNLNATDIFSNGWFRNYNAVQGMYSQAYGGYFYPSNAGMWSQAGGGTYQQMIFRDTNAGTIRGYIYSNGSGYGLLSNIGSWMFYVPYGSTRVNFPSGTGMRPGANSVVSQALTTYGTLALTTDPSGWHGMAMGTDVYAPILMFNGGNGGQYVQNTWSWEHYWDTSAKRWDINGTFNVGSYALYSGGHRVLTRVIVQEVAVGEGGACTAPSCPGGSSDQGSWTNGYNCYRNCLFGSASGWP